ncbi:uncharacterized protein [Apostichopus japonicus]|uniref:uncharacterized protein isoform X2 n=1 Tax=Stichopus japonicus TaxID=307972 RepID=UPI003AB72645
MEGDVSSQPKLAKFDIPAENVTEKIFAFERQLADLEEHCKLLKTSMSRDHWRKKPEKLRADEDGQEEMQMSTYTADSRRIQDYYCITQGVSERDGVIDARRLGEEDSPPRVDVNSPSFPPSSSEDATSLVNERSEKLTLFINPLSDIGERGTSEANLVKSCEWEAGRNRNLSESLQRSQCRLSASAMAAEEQDSAIGTPHPYLQRTTSFTFPELHSPSEESCALFQTSRDKPLAPLAPAHMGRVHVRVSNSDSQGEDFWEFDTCTSDLESVSLGTSPSSVDSHSPRFGNTSTAPYAKSPFTGMSSLGRSKSDRYLNVENWSLDQTSGTSSTSMNETLDLKELRPGRKPRRTVAATLRPPEMTVFLKEQQANVSNDYTQDNSAKVSGQNTNMKSEPCPEYDTEHTEEELTFFVPVVSSDSDNVEHDHESIILSISTSERSDVIDTSLKPVKKSWHQCIKDTVVNTIRSIFCTVEEVFGKTMCKYIANNFYIPLAINVSLKITKFTAFTKSFMYYLLIFTTTIYDGICDHLCTVQIFQFRAVQSEDLPV